MSKIKEILVSRDNLSEMEAIEVIENAEEAFENYLTSGNLDAAENICEEYFGLEPDYIDEIIYPKRRKEIRKDLKF